MPVQLILGVQLPDSATLAAFAGRTNADARAAVAELIAGRSERLFVAGPRECGKTHLLQAACRAVGEAGRRSVYLPLARLTQPLRPLLTGLAEMDCVCIDDVQAIAGDREAELALLGLSDQLRARRGRLFAAGSAAPRELGLSLPDLASRLGWGGIVHCHPLDEEDRCALLVSRAAQRGMDLPEATARWLVKHGDSGVSALMGALETLDRASLSAQRRLTIPFVKQVLSA
jgi:DnaA family protein